MDLHDIIFNNVPLDKLSKNDYIEIINLLKNEYKTVLMSKNRETYQNEITDLTSRLKVTEDKLTECQKSTKSMSGILNAKLTFWERLVGRLDLKKHSRR